MRHLQQQTEGIISAFINIPVIRLDSDTVRIPVGLLEPVVVAKSIRRVFYIKPTKSETRVWR